MYDKDNTLMEIIIDIDDERPIFVQLIEQIKSAVASDKLPPNEPLPSIRQLANDLDVNSKTIAKAYKLLERDAVIQSKGYRGTFIHPDAKANCDRDITHWAGEKLTTVISELRNAGVTDSEIRIVFNQLMTSPLKQGK